MENESVHDLRVNVEINDQGTLNVPETSFPVWIFRLILKWVPAAKKNRGIITSSGEKCPICGKFPHHSLQPSAEVKRHERALGMIASGHIARIRGLADEKGIRELEWVAGLHIEKSGRAGVKTVEAALLNIIGPKGLDLSPFLPENHLVEARIHVVVGKTGAGDGAIIDVWSLGPDDHPRRRRRGTRRDIQNVPALVLDAFQGNLYRSDRQIHRLVVERLLADNMEQALKYLPSTERPSGPLSATKLEEAP